MSAQDKLLEQILGQNLTSKWSGGHSPQDAARDMAKLMADAGITDIKQFGKIPVYEKAESKLGFQGQIARQDEDGNYYIMAPGGVDSEGFPYNSRQNVDASQLKPIYGKTITTPEGETSTSSFEPIDPSQLVLKDGVPTYKARDDFGNKETGQTIKRGSGRWEGQGGDNLFSGTGSGKGNTGYRVQFGPDGTPIFYTTEGSSSDLGAIAPLLSIASFVPGLQPFAMAANAAIAAHQGDALGALAGVAGLGGYSDVANAARMGKALQSGDPLAILMSGANMGGVADVGGVNLGDVSKGIGAAKAIKSGDPLAMLRYGMGAFSKGDSLASSIGPGDMDTFRDDLIPGYFQPGGEGYIEKKVTNPLGPTEEFNPDKTDWASMYKTVGGEGVDESNLSKLSPEERARYEALKAGDTSSIDDLMELPGQEMQIDPKNWESYNQNLIDIVNNKGGYTSQWQTVGNDRVMINDDGTGIGTNENGDSYALTEDEVNSMVKNGMLNTAASGYVAATGGTGDRPGGSGPAPKVSVKPVTPTAPAAQPTAQQSAVREMAPALLGIPGLGNVFYYGKDFSSQKQQLDPSGRLVQQEYDPLSVTQAGAELQLDKIAGTNENDVQALIQQIMVNSGGTATPEEIAEILGQQGNMYGT